MARHGDQLSLPHPMKRPFCPSLKVILSLFLILLAQPHPSASTGSSEVRALLELKSSLVDPLNVLDSWKDSSPSPCGFAGVTCDGPSGSVTGLALDGKNLSGVLPPSVFPKLINLTTLSMPSNGLTGHLPEDLTECRALKVLNFSDNFMNGSIPDLSALTGLEALDLSDNYFSGSFPGWLGNLTNLRSLGLGENDFDEGPIPENLGNLKRLTWLYLAGSNFVGQIPESVFELEDLGTLDFCKNAITGDFPSSITKLKNLWKVELYGNNFTGEIPAGIANLTLLQEFDISDNQMVGKIPEGMGNLKNLTVFHLSKNNFSGEIPRGFGEMENLFDFSAYKNGFGGEFPQNFGRFSPLNSIDISENKFSGQFPKYLCQKGKLQYLLALDNNFSGEFSDSYASCAALQRLRISQNKLDGKIPDGVWALPNVQVMDFADNSFTGTISPGVRKSLQLTEIMLSNNRFSGELPKELGNLVNLERIVVDNNKFSGKIPSELGGLKQLSSLHLEDNELIGSIPSELADCPRLVEIDLSSNSLTGEIPSSFAKMGSLNSMNLSKNQLSGEIPRNLDRLKLSSLDLSNNHFAGSVSPYLLTVAGNNAFRGNKDLCLDPKDENARRLGNSGLGFCDVENDHSGFAEIRKRLEFTFVFLVLVVIGGVSVVSCKSFKRGREGKDFGEEKGLHCKIESFQQVQLDADEICGGLDEDNLIGSGGTGKVYRLDLKKGCGTVAVKKLWRGDGVKLMAAEIEILGKIRHRNIVKLCASLTKGGSNYLIFEYMANGNLSQALHREVKAGKAELDWQLRYRIALGAAKGIAYLHHDCSPAIIHRDIKSTNILLDEDYEAKIADFGVAKVADGISPGGSEASCFAGTHGYMAPELAYSMKVTEKSDVYSFGVVLLELATGKKPVGEYREGKDIVYWVSTRLSTNDRGNLLEVLDSKVAPDAIRDDMIKVVRIAMLCTSKLPNLRPSMKEVVKMLVDAEPCPSRTLSPVGYKNNETPFV